MNRKTFRKESWIAFTSVRIFAQQVIIVFVKLDVSRVTNEPFELKRIESGLLVFQAGPLSDELGL